MSQTEQQFFALLRSGLWNNPVDESLFTGETEWSAILKMASMQTVSGVIYDGISTLPLNQQPPLEIMRRLFQTVIHIEQNNQLLNDRLNRIVILFQSEAIYPILLKGQGVALNYPNPSHRQCGDIDLYIGKKDYRKAFKLFVENNRLEIEELESYKHYHIQWDGVIIEFHRIVEQLPDPFKNKKFQQWTRYHLQKCKSDTWLLGQTEVLLPSANFNAVYIFNHALLHFISDGIGFRQLCDWILYLHKYYGKIDRSELMNDLKDFGLLRAWQIFGSVAVHELGLPKEEFPFYTEKFREISQRILLEDILLTGNFGRYDAKWSTRPAGYLSGKLHNFRMKNKRLINIYPIVRTNLLFYYIFYFTIGLQQIINDKWKKKMIHD